MISNCGHDENGKYTGGKAGDQTGGEWSIVKWYSRPWNVVLRHPDGTVRELIAQLATECANNDHIGYDQNSDNDNDGGRYSLWSQLAANDYDPRKITKDCETDCSNGVACIIKSAGYILNNDKLKAVSVYSYTGNLKSVLVKAGFYALTDSKYLKSDEYLYAGDILLYEGHHTATNITNGRHCQSYNVGWNKSGAGKWWYSVDGTDKMYYFNGVYLIDGKYYAFDADGWMVQGRGTFTTDDDGAINGIL